MREFKTHRTGAGVDAVVREVADDARREDCLPCSA